MLQQKWFSFKKDPSDDIQTHIIKIEDLCNNLQVLGEQISESMMMTKIIMRSPSNYKNFN